MDFEMFLESSRAGFYMLKNDKKPEKNKRI